MPGGGNVLATNYMYKQAPKDGTAIATINNADSAAPRCSTATACASTPASSTGSARPAAATMTWSWHTSGVKTIDDVMQRELVAGPATGTGSAR